MENGESPPPESDDVLIARLEHEAEASPADAGPRIRLGQALIAAGRPEEAASQLRLGARLEPTNPHVALLACASLAMVGRERDAALLLSSHVHAQRGFTKLAPEEIALIETFLRHGESFVRCHTAKALGRLGFVQALDALERCRVDPDAAVRMAAMASIKRLTAH